MRLRKRGGDRQEAPAAAATARKPKPPYSEWPDEAQKITTTLYKWSRDHQPHGDSITSLCRTYGAECSV
jgi:hypothetical protein